MELRINRVRINRSRPVQGSTGTERQGKVRKVFPVREKLRNFKILTKSQGILGQLRKGQGKTKKNYLENNVYINSPVHFKRHWISLADRRRNPYHSTRVIRRGLRTICTQILLPHGHDLALLTLPAVIPFTWRSTLS